MFNIKVSVIVPVYNAETYLRQCLDSIVSQTLTDIEIICVDDGSTDGSVDILNEYKVKDGRIRIYEQQNSFAGTARNNGMSHAMGKYLIFWDADDYFYPEALEKMYKQAEEDHAEICICGANRFSEDVKQEVQFEGYLKTDMLPDNIPFNMNDIPGYIMNFTCEAAWNKLFSYDFVKKEGLKFHPSRNGNDLYFTLMAMCKAEKITVVKENLISYRRQHGGSLVQTVDKSALAIFNEWLLLKEDLTAIDRFPEQSYMNKVLAVIYYNLQLSNNAKAFSQKVSWLKSEGLKAYGLEEKEEGYYYSELHAQFLSFLLNNEPDECMLWISNHNYWRISSIQVKLEKYKTRSEKYRTSLENSKQQLSEAKSRIEELKGMLSESRENLRNTRALLSETKEKNKQLQKELSEIKNSKGYKLVSGLTGHKK